MSTPDPDELAARYGDAYRKAERIEVAADRFNRVATRGDEDWGVGALIVDADRERVLFVREGETWLLPGGRLEDGESLAAGAAREVEEETGVTVEVGGLAAIAEQTFVHEETGATCQLNFATFIAEPATDASPAPDPDPPDPRLDEAAWLTDVPERTFDRDLVRRLVDAHVQVR